jgi:hypothetical protein
MTNEQIINSIREAKKGRYIKLKKVKDLGEGVTKVSDMIIRLGVNYSNMSINENRTTGSLPWGQWVEGLANLVIEHKGNYYLRITSTDPENPESGADVIKTTYLMNNAEITKEEAISVVGDKKMEGKASPVYNVKFENILSIGN